MSLEASKWAWEQKVTPSQKLVLLTLADRADEANSCFPSVGRICDDTGLNRKTVLSAIIDMEAVGILSVKRNYGASSRYFLNLQESVKAVPKTAPVPKQVPVPKTVLGCPKTGTATSTKNGTLNLPIESINKHKGEKADTNGTRLPADWVATDEYLTFCRNTRPDLNPKDIADQFRDYWVSVPGVKGKKLDWLATWRNWVRAQRKGTNPPAGNSIFAGAI